MLRLAWAWSLSLSGQEHRPRLLSWAPRPSPSGVPTPRCGHTPSAIRAVHGLESTVNAKQCTHQEAQDSRKKKCTVNLFKTTATNTHKEK